MKLKPIPDNTVVHTPTAAEAKELLAILHKNGYKWNMGDSLIDRTNWCGIGCTYHIYPEENVVTWGRFINAGAITLAEFKGKYVDTCTNDCSSAVQVEKPQPKVKVGDRVWAKIYSDQPPFLGTVSFIRRDKNFEVDIDAFKGQINKQVWCCLASDLEPYTESETKPTENMETKDYPPYLDHPKTVVETPKKELNLCELLQGHEGETFFSPISGTDIELKRIHMSFLSFWLDKEAGCTVECGSKGNQNIGTIDDLGRFQTVTYPYGSCMVYPSRALYEQYPLDPYTAWMKWREEQKKHWVSITAWIDCLEAESDIVIDTDKIYFRTPADRDKCIEEIKAIIEKYSK